MKSSNFDTRAILERADTMTAAELKRAIERADQLGFRQVHASLVEKMDQRRHPQISSADGGSQALRDDLSKTLIEIEKLIGRRNYLRRSLASRGCKSAIAKIVGDSSASGRQTLQRLVKAGRTDLALENVLVRHAAEFDDETVAKARRNLSQYAESSRT